MIRKLLAPAICCIVRMTAEKSSSLWAAPLFASIRRHKKAIKKNRDLLVLANQKRNWTGPETLQRKLQLQTFAGTVKSIADDSVNLLSLALQLQLEPL
jgi:hypothetical protein